MNHSTESTGKQPGHLGSGRSLAGFQYFGAPAERIQSSQFSTWVFPALPCLPTSQTFFSTQSVSWVAPAHACPHPPKYARIQANILSPTDTGSWPA